MQVTGLGGDDLLGIRLVNSGHRILEEMKCD